MTDQHTTLTGYLKNHGYSLTRQRQALFDLLDGKEPVSMRELSEAARPHMDRASVYRTIEIFERIGVVRRVHIGWKYKIELSDAFAGHHHHLTCLSCKKIIPINEQALETFIENLSSSYNFLPKDHQIEIQGYCSACKNTVLAA